MIITQQDNMTLITREEQNLNAFAIELEQQFDTLKSQNSIVDISSYADASSKDINLFLNISKLYKKAKKSFVLVVSEINFNVATIKFNVVRTKQEAYDIIEIEEIERDLL